MVKELLGVCGVWNEGVLYTVGCKRLTYGHAITSYPQAGSFVAWLDRKPASIV